MPPEARAGFRALAESERPFVLPGAHDGLSARLIERAGFKGLFVGGFASLGARHAVPDVGLMGLAEISAVARDVRAATTLPMMVDADDGYGDAKNVAHTVNVYERLGVQAIFLEDQASPKRCGHLAGKRLVAPQAMEAKIRAAVAERGSLFIVARTDARSVLGLDEALRRGERYLAAGADAIYVESPESVAELERIGSAFRGLNMASMLEGGKTPILKPRELHAMGYNIVIFGITLLLRIARTMQAALEDLRSERLALVGSGMSFEDYLRLVDLERWSAIERRFEGAEPTAPR
ncbi:MAG: isocitrate lyase/PEP mutase family protein [Alphaproteobacteria bacterium]|nr:isocitrate lyase/PEP mutase family protein [Alphaproteobacteria bacterium]